MSTAHQDGPPAPGQARGDHEAAARLIEELAHAGVRLWAEGDKLRFRAPKGALTAEHRERVRAHRHAVLALIRRDDGELPRAVPDPGAAFEPFPLTDVQAAYLLGRHDVYEYGGVACHGYVEIVFPELDAERLEEAWHRVVARHGMLRAVVHPDGHQRVLPEVPKYRVDVLDLSTASEQRAHEGVGAVRAAMDHRGYDPGEWPLFELRVTRTPRNTVLHLSIDMLVTDYAGIQVLLADLDRYYTDPGTELPAPAIEFRDYVVAARRVRDTVRYERDRAYWRRHLDTLPPAPELPLPDRGVPWGGDADIPEPGEGRPRFRRHTATLPAALWADVRARAAEAGVTASAAVLAAYAEVVARWSRHPRFTLNLTMQGRLPLHPDVDALVGDFTAVVPLAVDAGEGTTFADRARALGARLFDDLDHRTYSGVEVMREIARRHGRAAGMLPIVFTSALGLNDEAAQRGSLTGSGEPGHGVSQTPQVWLDCQAMERHGGLVVNWDVREGVFPPGLVEDAFAAFTTLLHDLADAGDTAGSVGTAAAVSTAGMTGAAGVTSTPGLATAAGTPETAGTASTTGAAWHSASPIPLPAAQRAVRDRVNATAQDLPTGLLHAPVFARADATPDAPAVIGGGTTWTYRETAARARAVAAALTRRGITEGEFVAVLLDKGPEQVAAVLGILLAGGAYLPVDTAQPAARRDAILTDAGVTVVLTQTSDVADELPYGIEALGIGGLPPGHDDTPPAAHDAPDRPAYVIYTSGSTGTPKGVVVGHRAARNTVEDINARFAVTAADRVLGLAGLGFDLSVYDIFGTLAAGGTLVLPDADRRGDPSHWAEQAARHGVTVWNSVPAQMQMLGHYLASCRDDERPDLGALRIAMLSGDWIPVSLPDRIRELVPGVAPFGLGGATEAAIWSIIHPIAPGVPGRWRSIPYGTPLANQSFRVRDDHGVDRPDWVPGELWIGGVGLAREYFGDKDRTAERFVVDEATGERFYRTGDLGRYLPDGTLEFLGREDAQVKIRGHRIECAEIEAALLGHPDVADAAVLVEGEEALERRLVAFVAPRTRTADDAPGPAAAGSETDLQASAAESAATVVADVDPARILRFADDMDDVALLAMAHGMRAVGLFAAEDADYGLGDLLDASGAAPRNRRLLRRWVRALTEHGLLERDPATGRLRRLRHVDDDALGRAWARLEDNHRGLDDGARLIAFLRRAAENLPALLTGRGNALDLLFPHGGTDTAEAAYRDNLISRYANRATARIVADLARRHAARPGTPPDPSPDAPPVSATPLRILEVGAGVGGTTADVVAALAALGDEVPVDYLFTDLSRFFLTEARTRFAAHPWMRYGLFDVNRDHTEQGYAPGSFDVVLAANVLHNALSADRVVAALGRLLAPGGHVVFLDTTRENHQVMTSMEFLMTFDEEGDHPDFDDVRHGRDRIFLERDEWLAVLRDAGAETRVCLPPAGDVLDRFGQTVFAARFGAGDGAGTPSPDVRALTDHVAERLPDHMVPARVEIVDALPLTGNGKVDRAALARRLAQGGSAPAGPARGRGGPPRDALEHRVAALWREVLAVDEVGRDDDFFHLGGDSLLLSQLAGRLRAELPAAADLSWEDLVRVMLAHPTVAALGTHLRRPAARDAAAATGSPKSPLSRLRGDGPGSRTRLLVHDGSGTLLPYRALVRQLAGRHEPLYGLSLADEAAYVARPLDTLVADLADDYAAAVADAGIGRADVVGYCMGGLIATELARRLPGHGVEVASLTVVSSHRVPYRVDDDILAEYGFARISGLAPAQVGLPADATALGRVVGAVLDRHDGRVPAGALADAARESPGEIGELLRRYAEVPPEERVSRIARALGDTGPGSRTATAYAVFRHSIHGVSRYAPEPYTGPLTLLRQSAPEHFLPGVPEDMAGFWRSVCPDGLTVTDVPGDHFGCMHPPHVADVAAALAGDGTAAAPAGGAA